MKYPEQKSKEIVFDDTYRQMESRIYTLPDGSENTYTITNAPEAALIFAITKEQTVLVLKQFFFSDNTVHYTLPAGIIDEGETPEQAAIRELKEETGANVEKILYLGHAMRSKWVVGTVHFFFVECGEIDKPSHEGGEFMEVDLISLKEIFAKWKDSEIEDIGTTACLGLVYQYLLSHGYEVE